MNNFDIYIIITAADFVRLKRLYPRLLTAFPSGDLVFVGSEDVGRCVRDAALGEKVRFLPEDELLPFNDVWAVMNDHLRELLGGEDAPRRSVGWYYQQFLKYRLADFSGNEYYMVWDGDTIPCRVVNMFSEDGHPYLDCKNEYHEEYFVTMKKLVPGLQKFIRSSFISEHMLFHCDSVRKLTARIEANPELKGTSFWERILLAIEPERIHKSAFSEFETYGCFMALTSPSHYRLREWHSFRIGGTVFDPNTICDRDFDWLGKDFDAISFEKNHSIQEGNGGLFDNPEYQSKLSARQMLQIAQEVSTGGYIESWGPNGKLHDPLD
ncbi:MAG: DUF6492 family protein [Lachnospiraceae bacterium]|nr:DUF6492 family protein [Lachnospiraceae bacterium]